MRPVLGLVVAGLLLFPRTAAGQAAQSSGGLSRVFVDVNLFGTASSVADQRRFTGKSLASGEVATTEVTYPKPTQETLFPLLDLGGGLRLARGFGLGALFSRASYDDPAGLKITVPHPFYLNAPGTAAGDTEALNRTEDATNVFVSVSPIRTARYEWRLYGGPTFFAYSADMVRAVSYAQTASADSPANVVTITGYDTVRVHGHAVGWHAGSDFAYGLTSMLSLIGGVRINEGTVTVDTEPLSGLKQDIRVGATRVHVGVRFHFGK